MSVTSSPALWLGEKKLSRILLIIGGILLAVAVVALFSYLLLQDMFAFGSFPVGTKICGVNVAGFSKEEAIEKCRRELAPVANRPLSIKVDQETYSTTPEEIGLVLEYRDMVNKAYGEAWSVNIFERMARRFLNRPKDHNISLMAVADERLVRDFVVRALGSINRPAQDAYIDVGAPSPVIVPAKDGRQADPGQLVTDTIEALGTTDRIVMTKVQRTPASILDGVFGKYIIINMANHTLTLYNREQPVAQYGCACGSASWPSPAGQWKIVEKQRNPSWKNPGSSWAKSMPAYIPPGPGNPLGTRAMPLNASGVLIHGTSSDWSIGQSVSHGCIRMHMRDVEQLFEMVEANTPVYIIKGPGNPGFDVTKKPFWMP